MADDQETPTRTEPAPPRIIKLRTAPLAPDEPSPDFSGFGLAKLPGED
jgi:hypothetical protein